MYIVDLIYYFRFKSTNWKRRLILSTVEDEISRYLVNGYDAKKNIFFLFFSSISLIKFIIKYEWKFLAPIWNLCMYF